MTTLSVPLPQHLEEFVNQQVKLGRAANKADVVRKAINMLREEEAYQDFLRADREVKEGKIIRGDLRQILKRRRK